MWRADEHARQSPRRAVLALERRFNADPASQRTVSMAVFRTVIGVMPGTVQSRPAVLLILTPLGFSADRKQDRGSHFIDVVARLRRTRRSSPTRSCALAERLKVVHPQPRHRHVRRPMLDDYVGDARTALIALVVAVGPSAIACVNVAN